jgi:hypothetical protein
MVCPRYVLWLGSFAFVLTFIANPAFFAAGATTFSFGEKDVLLFVDGASRTYRFEGPSDSARWAMGHVATKSAPSDLQLYSCTLRASPSRL